MEIEFKYRIPNEEIADKIWENSLFSEQEEEGSRKELQMHAIYYDTEDMDLAKNEIAYRVRREGERWIATVKWKGKSEDGLHVREELTVPVADNHADIGIFLESDIGTDLEAIVADKELKALLQTDILRKRFRIDTDDGLFEVSVDKGIVETNCGTADILEVEVELFSGETEELTRIGRMLREVYGLTPENSSKYSKGLEMIRANG